MEPNPPRRHRPSGPPGCRDARRCCHGSPPRPGAAGGAPRSVSSPPGAARASSLGLPGRRSRAWRRQRSRDEGQSRRTRAKPNVGSRPKGTGRRGGGGGGGGASSAAADAGTAGDPWLQETAWGGPTGGPPARVDGLEGRRGGRGGLQGGGRQRDASGDWPARTRQALPPRSVTTTTTTTATAACSPGCLPGGAECGAVADGSGAAAAAVPSGGGGGGPTSARRRLSAGRERCSRASKGSDFSAAATVAVAVVEDAAAAAAAGDVAVVVAGVADAERVSSSAAAGD